MDLSHLDTGKTLIQIQLEDARKKLGGNKALAERLGVHPTTLQRWKKGTKKIHVAQYLEIERILYGHAISESSDSLISAKMYPEHPANWKNFRRDGRPMYVPSSAKNADALKLCLYRSFEKRA